MADLGDLGNFLKEGSVANLDWLDVNEEEYRKEDHLPKQNLDISPDLQALWAHEDQPATNYLQPNTGAVQPRTMADLGPNGPVHGVKADDILKTARVALMVSPQTDHLRTQLLRRFTLDDLRTHRAVLAKAIEERGFLGKIYIAAADFPDCHNSPKIATTFVRRHAADAKFVQMKSACGTCVHAQKVGQKTNCAVFHKELVLEVPYTNQLAAEVEGLQQMRGKVVQASTGLTPKARIRLALLQESAAPPVAVYSGVGIDQNPKPVKMTSETANEQLIAASSLVRKKSNDDRLSMKAKPVVAFLRREMLKGRTATDLVKNLKVSFPLSVLADTRHEWEPVFNESGLYGAVYSTQESFDECREGADFLAKHNPGVRAMVAGAKCGSCIYNKISRCMLYGKPLVKEASELNTWDVVQAVVQEHRTAGRLQPWQTKSASWGATPRDALKALHLAANTATGPAYAPGRMDVFTQWAGGSQSHVASGEAKRQIVKTAAKYLNEGLYGRDLLAALKRRFEIRDLQAAAGDLKSVVAEQGLAGIYYVDPQPYDDYGHGCREASRLFRAKQVQYVKIGSKCGSCVHNHNNHCAQLNKPLVVEPPYLDKAAMQQAMLATGPSTEIDPASLVNNGLSMMTEYQLQHGGMDFDLNPTPSTGPDLDVQIGTGKVKL
jgi:hypothetical protein